MAKDDDDTSEPAKRGPGRPRKDELTTAKPRERKAYPRGQKLELGETGALLYGLIDRYIPEIRAQGGEHAIEGVRYRIARIEAYYDLHGPIADHVVVVGSLAFVAVRRARGYDPETHEYAAESDAASTIRRMQERAAAMRAAGSSEQEIATEMTSTPGVRAIRLG